MPQILHGAFPSVGKLLGKVGIIVHPDIVIVDAILCMEVFNVVSAIDHAGNAEIQNKRRSQNGYVAMSGGDESSLGAPVLWASKVTSVAFAHPEIAIPCWPQHSLRSYMLCFRSCATPRHLALPEAHPDRQCPQRHCN